jgi:hypothetical protein
MGSLWGNEYKGVRLAAPSYYYRCYAGNVNLRSVYMVKRRMASSWLEFIQIRYAVVTARIYGEGV